MQSVRPLARQTYTMAGFSVTVDRNKNPGDPFASWRFYSESGTRYVLCSDIYLAARVVTTGGFRGNRVSLLAP